MHYSPSSQGKNDGQNAAMCLSVLNWINDLFVSMFLEVIAKKKKKKRSYTYEFWPSCCLYVFVF